MSPQDRSTRSFSEFVEKNDLTHQNIENRLFHDISIRVAKLINLIMMTAPFAIAWYAAYADKTWVRFYMRGHWLVIGLFVVLYFSIGKVYDAFRMSYSGIGEMIYSQRPIVVAVENESDYARILRQVDKATVVDLDDTEGFTHAILDVFNSHDYSDSKNSRDVFKTYCSSTNAKKYVRLLEKIANERRVS